MNNLQSLPESSQQLPAEPTSLHCSICGFPMYATDKGNHEVTYHCSSPEARFWEFDRGSAKQAAAKQHWDQSIREVYLNRG